MQCPAPATCSAHRVARVMVLFSIAAVASVGAGHAAVFKCTGANGPVYQETACPPGKQLRDFAADPPPLSIIPGAEYNAGAQRNGAAAPRAASAARGRDTTRATSGRSARKERGEPAQRRHAHTGMSEAEVLAQLGQPDITARGAAKGRTRWSYLPAAGDPETITTLYLAGGVVVDVERKLVKR